MTENVYRRLARVLDTLPNGFPATDSGVEIKILKKIFTPEEADLFCDLRLHMETAAQIAKRTGRPLEGLEEKLTAMWKRGEIGGVDFQGTKLFKMIPWVVGIYEFQIDRMDRELAELVREYAPHFGPLLLLGKPKVMQVVPVQRTVDTRQQALSYQQVADIIDSAQSFAVNECICNKSQKLLGTGCDKPKEICLGLSTVAGVFDRHPWGRPISRQEAYAVLKLAEEKALVHLTANVRSEHMFICNCCGCCCPVLGALKALGTAEHVNSSFTAEIDGGACTACGICAEERCQVAAIEPGDDTYRVIREKCIGCGLCVSTCPEEAIRLVPRPAEEMAATPLNEEAWMEERARDRNLDFSELK
jgi:ferredoxin